MCDQSCDWRHEINGLNNFSNLTSASSDSPLLWGICWIHVLLLYALCCTYPWLMLMQSILFLTCFHDSLLDVMWNHLFDVFSIMIRHVMVWYLFVVCWWDTQVVIMHILHWDPFYVMLVGCSSCTSLCHIDRSLLIESFCRGTSLRATPAWGNFFLYDISVTSMYITTIENT